MKKKLFTIGLLLLSFFIFKPVFAAETLGGTGTNLYNQHFPGGASFYGTTTNQYIGCEVNTQYCDIGNFSVGMSETGKPSFSFELATSTSNKFILNSADTNQLYSYLGGYNFGLSGGCNNYYPSYYNADMTCYQFTGQAERDQWAGLVNFTIDFLSTHIWQTDPEQLGLSSTTAHLYTPPAPGVVLNADTVTPLDTDLMGHCLADGDRIAYQTANLPWYLPYDQMLTQGDTIYTTDCSYSDLEGHTDELVYTLPIPSHVGANLFCLAEINHIYSAGNDDPEGDTYTIAPPEVYPCINFYYYTPAAPPPIDTSTAALQELDPHNMACTAEQWATAASGGTFFGWNWTEVICGIKEAGLDLILKPVSWVTTKISNLTNVMKGIFPFNMIEKVRGDFSTSTANYTARADFHFINTAYASSSDTISTTTGMVTGSNPFSITTDLGGIPMSVDLFSKQNIIGLVGQNAFDGYYLILRLLVWLLFGFYCYDLATIRIDHLLGGTSE